MTPVSDDDLSVRRWMKLLETQHRYRPPRAEMELFDQAEQALEEGRHAERRGDLDEAVRHLTAAAREGVGDSLLLLAGVLVRAKRYAEALNWCQLAEEEGFDEAVDLAARCRTALGMPFPIRADKPAPPGPASVPGHPRTEAEEDSGTRHRSHVQC